MKANREVEAATVVQMMPILMVCRKKFAVDGAVIRGSETHKLYNS
jgi:hypothetical protein